MVVKFEYGGPIMKREVRQPKIRTYMDDFNITSSSITVCSWILCRLGKLIFLTQTVYDVLPSPENLYICGMSETPSCRLCTNKRTVKHIPSGDMTKYLCHWPRQWPHQSILAVLSLKRRRLISSNTANPPHKRVNRQLARSL